MNKPFAFTFSNGQTAQATKIHSADELTTALQQLNLPTYQPVLVVVGGASKMSDEDLARLRLLFVEVLAPLAEALNLCVVDGGTDAGVMRMMGQARSGVRGTFPLIGVAPVELATPPGGMALLPESAFLEPNHTHFVLVPGSQWGDESPWIAQVASSLAGDAPSAAVLINGGEVTWIDACQNVEAQRPVVVIGGSGRVADMLAAALKGHITDERAKPLINSGLVQAVELRENYGTLDSVLRAILST